MTVIVAGAGIVGSACAYFLGQAGARVHLLDASAPAAEASGAADGAVSVASKRPGPLMTAALSGISLYRDLQESGPLSGLFHRRSTFIVAASEDEQKVLEAHAAALADAGVVITALAGNDIARRFPALSSAASLVIEVQGEGHAIGYQVVHRLIAASGATVHRSTPVTRLVPDRSGTRLAGVETPSGFLGADAVVLATGNGSAALLGLADVLTPRKGQLLITERDPALNAAMPGSIMSGRYLLSKGSQKTASAAPAPTGPARGFGLVIDPLRTGQFLIGGTREDHGNKQETDLSAVSRILADAVALVPDLARLRLLRSFAGARAAVRDGLPLVGRLPGLSNAVVATGFEGDGICLGPVMGRAVARLLLDKEPGLNLAPFAPNRFQPNGDAA